MEDKLKLSPISIAEIDLLDQTEYKNLSDKKRIDLVNACKKGLINGNFFRFYLVKDGENFVGVINIYGHGTEEVSVAPYILESCRNKGYAKKSLEVAYSIVKELGFKFLIADIKKENVASQNLHLKLGFKFVQNRTTKNGNLVKKYVKQI